MNLLEKVQQMRDFAYLVGKFTQGMPLILSRHPPSHTSSPNSGHHGLGIRVASLRFLRAEIAVLADGIKPSSALAIIKERDYA